MRARPTLSRGEAEARPRGEPAVHTGNPVVACAQKAGHGLQVDQREDPVVGCIGRRDGPFEVMVLRRDQNVEVVRCHCSAAIGVETDRRGTLHEGRMRRILDDQTPGLITAERGRQISEQGWPVQPRRRQLLKTCALHRNRTQLRQEGMPGMALMRPKSRER